MNTLFWISLFLLVYPIVGYPLVLAALIAGKRPDRNALREYSPSVSMLLSVYNEAAVIQEKIDNFLALEYPEDRLELLVISDGSDDRTDAIVAAAANDRLRLLRQEGRLGKTSALNLGAGTARGDILFFTDADSMLSSDCLKRLLLPFADPAVALVSGRSEYRAADGRETSGSLYRRYEEWIKEREGALFGIAGADGAVYALRRERYTPLPPEYINDLLHPVQVVLAGEKATTRPDAVVSEPGVEDNSRNEFSRQTRIMAQSWLIFLRHCIPLVRARRFGFLWQFLSHKVLRWLALPFLVLTAGTALCLPGWFPSLTLAGILGLCLYAALGRKSLGGFAGRLAWLFMVQGAAALNGLFRLWRGDQFVIWKPRGN